VSATPSLRLVLPGPEADPPQETPPDNAPVGRLEDGFSRTAGALDAAFALLYASLTAFLLYVAREISRAGQPEGGTTVAFRPNLSELARIKRCDRRALGRAFAQLVKDGVFVAVGEGRYLLNEDFRTWRDENGTSLLDEDQIAWCLEAAPRRPETAPAAQKPQVQPCTCCAKAVGARCTCCAKAVGADAAPAAQKPQVQSAPLEGTPAPPREEENTREYTRGVCVASKVPIPEYTEAQVQAVADRVEQLGGMGFWGSKVRGFSKSYPLDWIEAAAERAAAKGKKWDYVHGILKEWLKAGGPDSSTASRKQRTAPPAPPPQYHTLSARALKALERKQGATP
jgi:hypothetical protein